MTAAEAAAAATVEKFAPLLLAICGRFAVGRDWLRADLVSDSTYRLWRAAADRDPAEEFTAALARVVITRACVSRLRHERAKAPEMFDAGPPVPLDGEPVNPVELVAGAERDPAELAELLDLPPLLARLGDRRREFVLRSFSGETCEAIGQSAGVTGSTAACVVRTAVARLRREAGTDED